MWWPETGSNRRRRPFQGRLPSMLSGLGSMQVVEGMGVTRNCFGPGWDHLGSFRFLCVRYLYVDPVFRGRSVVLGQGESPLEFGGDWLPGLGDKLSTSPIWPGS